MQRGDGPLFERAQELGELRQAIERGGGGAGSVRVIAGAAGVGKTALLAAAAASAAGAGFAVLSASAALLETDLSWNVVQQLFAAGMRGGEAAPEELLQGAAGLAAAPLGIVDEPASAGALHGLYWLTAELAERTPLLLSVDDAHWADEPSLRYLAYLAERIADLPVLLLVGVRTGEAEAVPLRALAAAAATRSVELRELSPGASAELARQELGAGAAKEFCEACHLATNGNPFLLRELAGQLRRDGVEPTAERSEEVAAATPEAVIAAVGLRLSRLPAPAPELASAVAIVGDGVRLPQAAELAGLGEAEATRAADALAAAGILRRDAPLRFVHPLVREVVYGAVPPFARGEEHRRAARLLAASGADSQHVAAQLLRADPAGDPWAVAALREAASSAMAQGAPQVAAELLARAIAEPPRGAARADLLAELGQAEMAAGRPGACERLGESVSLIGDPRRRARVALDHGRALYVTGRPLEAAEVLERGHEELVRSGVEERSLAAELRASWLAVARTELPLRSRAAELAREVSASPPDGDSYGERALLAQVAGELTFAGEPRELPLRLARAALGDGELIVQETSDGLNWLAAIGALGWGDEFDAYDALQRSAQADARRRGSAIGLVNGSYGLSFSHYYRGHLMSAIAAAQQAIEAEPEGWLFFLPAARAQLSWALIERGELAAAAAQLELAHQDATWRGSSMQALVFECEARLHLARSEPAVALEAALAAGRVLEEALIPSPSVAPWRARAAVAAARLGRTEQAEALLSEGLARARRFGAPRPIGVALIAAGQVRSGAPGRRALEEAVAVLAGSPARLEHARALVLYGSALRRAGHDKAARDPLVEGLDMAASFGAAPLAAFARDELVAAGARPRRARSSGVESLTPSQLRVAELAAEDLSNREIAEALFVSRRTVETHLTHAYRKLGIDSRKQLARALREAGAADAARPG
ncbi:MAG TPA: AAA family ATPase [Solirubrobacterales bacterium]|nr:AAA family ATPase [Solirubrobacterales bacterium]